MKKISIEFINTIANYLAQRPYIETYQMIQELGKLEDIEILKDKSATAEPKKS